MALSRECVCCLICSFNLFYSLLSLFLSFCSSCLPCCSSLPELPADSWITMYQCSARNWLPDKIMFCLILGYCSVMKANSVWHWEQEKVSQVWVQTEVTGSSCFQHAHAMLLCTMAAMAYILIRTDFDSYCMIIFFYRMQMAWMQMWICVCALNMCVEISARACVWFWRACECFQSHSPSWNCSAMKKDSHWLAGWILDFPKSQ